MASFKELARLVAKLHGFVGTLEEMKNICRKNSLINGEYYSIRAIYNDRTRVHEERGLVIAELLSYAPNSILLRVKRTNCSSKAPLINAIVKVTSPEYLQLIDES